MLQHKEFYIKDRCDKIHRMRVSQADFNYHGKAVVFDLDDTLYKERDYAISGFKAVAALFSDSPYEAMREAFLKGKNPLDAALASSSDNNPPSISDMLSAYRNHVPEISLSDGAREMLSSLSEAGIALGLVTDGRSISQRNKINALGIKQFFDEKMIIISEEAGGDKMSGKGFRQIVRMLPEASRFYYIADNPAKDFYMPNLMGWNTIQLLDRPEINIHPSDTPVDEDFKPLYTVDAFNEITELILNAK